MKKILLSVALLTCLGFGMSAKYTALIFTDTTGKQYAVPAQNLVISIQGSTLVAETGSDRLELPTSSLMSMQFGDDNNTTGLNDVILSGSGELTVVTLDGKPAGSFSSIDDARASLDSGVYIMKLADGSALKIYINK